MRSYAAHFHVELIASAAEEYRLPIEMLSFTDHEAGFYLKLPISIQNIFNPLMLFWRIRRTPKQHVLIIREFLTLPLLAASPFLWFERKRVFWVLIHNLQRAHSRPRDKIALRLLMKLGFRFIALESDAGIRELEPAVSNKQIKVLPFGIPQTKLQTRKRNARVCVGVIGNFRPEKGQAQLLDILAQYIQNKTLDVDVLVGCPDAQFRHYAEKKGFLVRDTKTHSAYQEAMRLCDIVVLNYTKDSYFYRTSATILDAAVNGSAIVCPDYPILAAQLKTPCKIGATFRELAEIPQAIIEAQRILIESPEVFVEYINYRNSENIAGFLRKMLSDQVHQLHT